ncbi:uncharacterized protein LOC132469332 [Gadus macrocephalus]|uniref:uncharacterized protein LOC132469332 n=1 Tax=Gadus macrocephalus TaxID=80720 RepID=UPI0028CB606B|nr:uncharacterized protein LOC132469332 [Gadus macrocephalus]
MVSCVQHPPVHGLLLNLRRGRRETNQQLPMSGVLFGLLDDERNTAGAGSSAKLAWRSTPQTTLAPTQPPSSSSTPALLSAVSPVVSRRPPGSQPAALLSEASPAGEPEEQSSVLTHIPGRQGGGRRPPGRARTGVAAQPWRRHTGQVRPRLTPPPGTQGSARCTCGAGSRNAAALRRIQARPHRGSQG